MGGLWTLFITWADIGRSRCRGDAQVARPDACLAGFCYGPVKGASSFSAFSLCTAQATQVLAAEGEDDSICRDGDDRSRAEIHADIEQLIADALAKNFAP